MSRRIPRQSNIRYSTHRTPHDTRRTTESTATRVPYGSYLALCMTISSSRLFDACAAGALSRINAKHETRRRMDNARLTAAIGVRSGRLRDLGCPHGTRHGARGVREACARCVRQRRKALQAAAASGRSRFNRIHETRSPIAILCAAQHDQGGCVVPIGRVLVEDRAVVQPHLAALVEHRRGCDGVIESQAAVQCLVAGAR